MSFGKMTAGLLLAASTTQAAVVFDDTFEDGGRTNGSDPTDIVWYVANQNITLGVVNNSFAGGSSTKALQADQGTTDAFKRVMGQFSSTSLADGDTLSLSFAFRSVTATPANNSNGFRFGIYNSNGTKITVDEPSTGYNSAAGTREDDDFGYNVRIPTGTAASPDLIDEAAGDNTLGGAIAPSIRNAGPTSIGVNSTAAHLIEVLIARTGSQLDFTLKYDTATVATGTDSGSIITTFDAVYFGTGSTTNFDYMIDNVKLEIVPEPAALGLFAASGLLVGRRRRN